ncbi:flippase [Pontibacter cellulosilyticus]|uniref:Flippase n=1 Tax=Pontibacter cellulosilyticus TaxID=1720253 RepID=A0A923N7W7_9BACT|nr:flippase [Pontibacter cellulosilyticus]MBC5992105.1 flippase [Pontibacter cellulosilyticus]
MIHSISSRIKLITSNVDDVLLLKNFIYMGILQGTNYLLPLITVPYIARIISPDHFGLVSYSQALITYSTILIHYGFDYTSTREIATKKNNTQYISTVFSNTIYTKFLIFLICIVVFIPLVLFVPKFSENSEIYLVTFLINIGAVLVPNWLFQGMEKLKYLAYFNLFIKAIFTLLIFVLVKNDGDYLLIPLSSAIGQIVVGIICFWWSIKYFNLNPLLPKIIDVIKLVKEGFPIFASSIAVNIYTTTNLIVLGFLATDQVVGIYSASSKLILVFVSGIMMPVGLALFPYIGKKLHESRESGMVALRAAIIIVGSVTFVLSILIYTFSDLIVHLVYGQEYIAASNSLKVLSFLPFIIGLNNILGTQGVLNLKMDKEFLAVTSIGAVCSILLNYTLIPLFAEIGTATAWVVTEVIITITFYIILYKKGLRLI